MSKIVAVKTELQAEPFYSGAAAASSTVTKVAQNVQFILESTPQVITFKLNGLLNGFNLGAELDICEVVDFNSDLFSVAFASNDTGVSGELDFDITRYPADDSAPQTIFSTRPKISYLATTKAWYAKNLLTETVLHTQAGITEPVFSQTAFTAGDKITLTVIGSALQSQDLFFKMVLLPKN